MLTMQNSSKTSKVLGFLRGHKAAVTAASFVCAASSMALTAGAEGAVTPAANTDYQTVINQVTAVMTSSNVATVLAYAVGSAVVIVFTWWAARKVASIIKKAFMRGKLKF